MKINCSFYYSSFGYTCHIGNQLILPNIKLEFTEVIKDEKTFDDIQFINFFKCNIPKVPQGLLKTFPNAKGMQIHDSGLKELSRADLFEYQDFKTFYFGDNKLDFLPGDLFADCKSLEQVFLYGNPLTTVEPNILNGLEHLKVVSLCGKNIDYGYIRSDSAISRSDSRLVTIKVKLLEEFNKKNNQKAKEMSQKVENVNVCSNKSRNRKNRTERLQAEINELKKLNHAFTKDKTLTSDLKTFIQNDETLKDFNIVINDRKFPVHKLLLAARSPTLAEVLRNNPNAENINIVDVSVEIFEDILKFLYTDELPIDSNFFELFSAAGRLKIDGLKNYAAQKILKQLNIENALEVLNLGNKYGHDLLRKKAFEEIKRKYPKIEFKDEVAMDGEKIKKIIEIVKKQEEALRMLEEEMKNLMK